MSEAKDWELLARYLSGECSAAEKEQVEALAAADAETRRILDSMRAVWEREAPPAEEGDVDRLWDEVAAKAGIGGTGAWWRPLRRYAAAAAVLLACSLGYYGLQGTGGAPSGVPVAWEEIRVESGQRQTLTLGDGTQVHLDAGSVLRFPAAFEGERRAVMLDGEGYFEVRSDAARPFVVQAGPAVVTVLGTRFNVRAWRPEGRVTVAVAEGRVALGGDGAAEVEIAGGQWSVLPQDGAPTAPQSVDVARHLGWMRQHAAFDDVPLHEILYQLERWYGVRFLLEDEAIGAERLTLRLEGQAFDEVMDLVGVLTGLESRRAGSTVRLVAKGGG